MDDIEDARDMRMRRVQCLLFNTSDQVLLVLMLLPLIPCHGKTVLDPATSCNNILAVRLLIF